LEVFFWIIVGIVFYSYIGYGILLIFLVLIKEVVYYFIPKKKALLNSNYQPEVTLFVAAYNEIENIENKVRNSFSLDYPKNKVKHIWITDGSNDGSPELLKTYDNIEVYHEDKRAGKINAMKRGMQFVKTPIVIFSDGNTILSHETIKEIVKAFEDIDVGCVSGEKKIYQKNKDVASSAGEGFYWKYESFLKKLDSKLYSTVGAAGELFAIRTSLFEEVEQDTLLDDFVISLRIAKKGYKIKYCPKAYASETASINIKEELKRKVRIASGAFQTFFRDFDILNPFKTKILSFQYFSHKVMRWIFVPLSLLFLFPTNLYLVNKNGFDYYNVYTYFMEFQLLIYLIAIVGWILENQKIRIKLLFIPYYIIFMNFAMFLGFFKYLRKTQSVNWERAKRA